MGEDTQDLPLHSLQSDFKVEHYLLELTCSLENQNFIGNVYVFVRKVTTGSTLVLDLKDLDLLEVVEVDTCKEDIDRFLGSFDSRKSVERFKHWTSKSVKNLLEFTVEEWCVKVEELEMSEAVICFRYHTKLEGSSVSWYEDDDGNPCCLTPGSLINNRSLMPSQDAPTLMATWQLLLRVPDGFIGITTGDNAGTETENGTFFHTSMLLPMSTFAIAIGKWRCVQIPLNIARVLDDRRVECRHLQYPCPFAKVDTDGPYIASRVFCSESTDPTSLSKYIPRAIEALHKILGRHVVPKLDFLILPKTVACLGFASPGLIMISPSTLCGRQPMLPRLAHEISHSWFGINIGPKNWNEEWISEGFATFMEDVVELKLSNFPHRSDLMMLKAINRYQILKSDCQNVDPSLQCLKSNESTSDANVVVNGLNREKLTSQIPYLKGYFFLVEMANIVGFDTLLLALRSYVEHFHGCLVTTTECVDFFCRRFPQKEQILDQAKLWLHNTTLPQLSNILTLNRLDVEVSQHVEYWKRRLSQFPPVFSFSQAMSHQLLALLDRLLELNVRLQPKRLQKFVDHYEPHLVNADTYHRVCELIISQQCTSLLPMVRSFLLQHPAMGAYLYGELMYSDRPEFQIVATDAYTLLETKLDVTFRAIIRDIVVPQE